MILFWVFQGLRIIIDWGLDWVPLVWASTVWWRWGFRWFDQWHNARVCMYVFMSLGVEGLVSGA